MVNKHFYIALIALVLTAGLIFSVANRGVPKVLHTNLENLPMEIGGFQGREDFFDKKVYDALQADLHVFRHFHAPMNRELSLYIGYYGTAKGGRTGHNPYACLPGAGWGITDTGTIEVRPSYYPSGVKINYVVATRDGVDNVIFHWYQSAATHILATGWQQNIHRFRERVFHNRNDGAYLQVYALTQEGRVESTQEMLKDFSLALLELLPAYWPIEG